MASPPDLAQLASAFENLQAQLNQAQSQISQLSGALGQANQVNEQLRKAVEEKEPPQTKGTIKLRKPEPFRGKGSIQSWITHMENYTRGSSPQESFSIAISYLDGNAHEWWIVHQSTEEGNAINEWSPLKDALLKIFQSLNKVKIARDKLAKWRQVKDVTVFNEDFLRIILDIPNISEEEKIDRYTRGLKPRIWQKGALMTMKN